MDNFVNLNNLKNSHMTVSEFILLLHSGASLSYHSAKFGYNRKTQYRNMDKIVDWRPKTGL